MRQYLRLGGEVHPAGAQRPRVDSVGHCGGVKSDKRVGVIPVTPGLVSLVHDDRLQRGAVVDQLVKEAHTQGPSSNDQVVGGQGDCPRHPDLSLSCVSASTNVQYWSSVHSNWIVLNVRCALYTLQLPVNNQQWKRRLYMPISAFTLTRKNTI